MTETAHVIFAAPQMQCVGGAPFLAVIEATMISLGAFVFHRWALSFFKLAIFRFPDYKKHL